MIISGTTIIGGVLAIAVSWTTLDLPWFASSQTVADVKQFSQGTREIVLNQEWFKVNEDIKDHNRRLEVDPNNKDLRFALGLLLKRKAEIERQLKLLAK